MDIAISIETKPPMRLKQLIADGTSPCGVPFELYNAIGGGLEMRYRGKTAYIPYKTLIEAFVETIDDYISEEE